MRKIALFAVPLSLILFLQSWRQENELMELAPLQTQLVKEFDGLEFALQEVKQSTGESAARSHFLKAREYFKHLEFLIEHISPKESRYRINGALVPKMNDEEGPKILAPKGFQVIEEMIVNQEVGTEAFQNECQQLAQLMQHLKLYYVTMKLEPSLLIELMQLEVYRVVSLNIAGIDATYLQNNVQEAIWVLDGFQRFTRHFSLTKKDRKQLNKLIDNAKKFLLKDTDFETFNRLDFITLHAQPLLQKLEEIKPFLAPHNGKEKRALVFQQEAMPFSVETFNKRYFSMYYNDTLNLEAQAELGKLLFFDPILSGNGQRACASCHQGGLGYSENKATSTHFDGEQSLGRNAPSLVNVFFQRAFFWDGRAYQLEQQALDVIHNKNEMNFDIREAINRLRSNPSYQEKFNQAFKIKRDQQISEYAIQKALTEFQKTLVGMNSRFDQYLKGNKKALNADEKAGFNLFEGKALCGTCHFFPLFNGSVPPLYKESEFEVLGVPSNKEGTELDTDKGRGKLIRQETFYGAFKTPTVRNVEVTGPYMHNGVFTTLEEVVDFYHKGGGAGMGLPVENQTLPFDSLELNDTEKRQLVAFMKSLTDYKSLIIEPFALPSFGESSVWNERKWGGQY